MQLNTEKCVVLRCTRSSFPITLDYKLDDQTIEVLQKHKNTNELFFMKACSGHIIIKLSVKKQANF